MKTAGVAQLKARLSRYLEHVKGGEVVVVTERGLPVAKLVPLQGRDQQDARRERLTRAGLLRPGTGRVRRSLLDPPQGTKAGSGVLQALLAEREEGR